MKAKIGLAEFKNAVSTLIKVVSKKNNNPILENLKLHVTEHDATLIGTDLNINVRCNLVEVNVQAGGDVLIDASVLREILLKMPECEHRVELESDDRQVVIRSERSEYILPIQPPDEFPDAPEFSCENHIEIPAGVLKRMIRRTAFATSKNSSKYALTGVLIEVGDDPMLRFVSSDERRMAIAEGKYLQRVGFESGSDQTVASIDALRIVEQIVADESQIVRLAIDAKALLANTGPFSIYSRLLEGKFPKWRAVIPPDDDAQKIELTVGQFMPAVRQAGIMTSVESSGVLFSFVPGSLILTSSAAEVGQARIDLPVEFSGNVKFALDPKFVQEFLKVLDEDRKIVLSVIDSNRPVKFTVDNDYTYLVMPLTLDR